jgi:hypothetical protein
MKISLLAALCLATAAHAEDAGGVFAVVNGPGGTVKAPLFSDRYADLPVAKVDSRVVTLSDLSGALAAAHAARASSDSRALHGGKKDYAPVLDRLIAVRLIVLEAHDIGIDEEPDVKEQMTHFRESGLREGLKGRVVRDVAADSAEVELIYKELAREWKVRSLLFPAEADARAALAEAKAGKAWDDVVKTTAATGKAKGGSEPQLISAARRALPLVLEALKPLKAGETSAPLRVEKGFALLHVDAIGFPEDAQKRHEAEDRSIKRRQTEALEKYYSTLVKQVAAIDDKRIAKLDLEARRPGFDALLKDKRVLARIKGGKDITVGDVAEGIRQMFFHGIKQAIASKKVNKEKLNVFNTLLYAEVFDVEAKRQHIDDTPEFRRAISDQHDALVFGKFVEKVIVPAVKVTEGDVKTFYDQHRGDYTYPAFYTLSSIAFESAKAAQASVDKLKAGTDFKWLKSNAPGQLPEDRRDIEFEGSTVSGRGIPADLGKLLDGARAGDLRIYAARDGTHYLIQVKAVTPPAPQPYEEARPDIAPKVQRLKVNQSIEEWVGKLRKAREVSVYISQLDG